MSPTRRNCRSRTLLASVLLAGCSGDAPPAPALTAADLGVQEVLAPAQWLAEAPWSLGDRSAGAGLYRQCEACHGAPDAGVARAGPPLRDLFGRPAGASDGFAYSPALSAGGFVWTPAALDAWLHRPLAFLPGNQMAFGGLYDEQARRDLIAYLLEATDTGDRAVSK